MSPLDGRTAGNNEERLEPHLLDHRVVHFSDNLVLVVVAEEGLGLLRDVDFPETVSGGLMMFDGITETDIIS